MHRPIRLLACALAFALAVPASAADRPDPEAVVGMRLADGTGYPSLVRLAHQADSSRDGALLMVFEQHGLAGIPLWRSDDDGAHWHFQQNVVDQKAHRDALHWQLRWQPNLTETWRDSGPLGLRPRYRQEQASDERGPCARCSLDPHPPAPDAAAVRTGAATFWAVRASRHRPA